MIKHPSYCFFVVDYFMYLHLMRNRWWISLCHAMRCSKEERKKLLSQNYTSITKRKIQVSTII